MKRRYQAALAGTVAGAIAVPLLASGNIIGRRRNIQQEPPRSPSYWMATIPELPRFPQLDGDISVDVAVVGGGFTGLAAAYYLKRHDPSISVLLLESQTVGSGSSTRNSGAVGRDLRGQESTASIRRGYDLLQKFGDTEELGFDLEEEIPVLRLHRTLETVDEPDIAGSELASQIGSDFYSAADAFSTSSLHPGKLITSLVRSCQRLGVGIYEHSPVIKLGTSANRPALTTPNGRISAGDVILATNAYTPQLGIASKQLLIMHHRVIVTRPLTAREWEFSGLERWPMRLENGIYYTHTVRVTPDRSFFFRHVLGHRPLEAVDWEINSRDIEAGQRALLRRYPWLEDTSIDYTWHGVTARTRDLWPVVGEIDDHVYLSGGYNGSGVMPSHYFGYLLARRILGHDDPELDQLIRLPDEHPDWPPEMLRHTLFQGAMRYRRLLDGR